VEHGISRRKQDLLSGKETREKGFPTRSGEVPLVLSTYYKNPRLLDCVTKYIYKCIENDMVLK
jgi:hypothetical protein